MPFSEAVCDALVRVHVAVRTLKIARDVQEAHHRLSIGLSDAGFLIDDATDALVRQLHDAEATLAALIAAEGGSIVDPVHGHVLAMRTNDRRSDARPKFILTRLRGLGAASPSQQRQYGRARA